MFYLDTMLVLAVMLISAYGSWALYELGRYAISSIKEEQESFECSKFSKHMMKLIDADDGDELAGIACMSFCGVMVWPITILVCLYWAIIYVGRYYYKRNN